jgi:hypothetical protein
MNIKELNHKKMSDKEFARKRAMGRLVMFRNESAYNDNGDIVSRTEWWRDVKTKKEYKIKVWKEKALVDSESLKEIYD